MWLGAGSDRSEFSSRTSGFASCGELGRRTIVCLLAATGLTGANALAITALYGSPAGAASAAVAQVKDDDDQACHGHTGDPYYPAAGFGPAVKTVTITEPGGTTQNYSITDASTQGTELGVIQGATVAVTISWDPRTFSGSTVNQVRDCVHSSTHPWKSHYGSGKDLGTPSDTELKPAPNNGTFTTFLTITESPGITVCDRGRVSGTPVPGTGNTGTEKSAQLCFTVQMPAVTPEVRSSIMLPIAATGLIAVASALAYRRRRRAGWRNRDPTECRHLECPSPVGAGRACART
jgi:hypothetical protein